MDNTSAVTYINKMGGAHTHPSCHTLPRTFGIGVSHNLLVRAQYIPGIQNVVADRESRVFLAARDWKLKPAIFNRLYQTWGPLNIDLFVSRLTTQLDQLDVS